MIFITVVKEVFSSCDNSLYNQCIVIPALYANPAHANKIGQYYSSQFNCD